MSYSFHLLLNYETDSSLQLTPIVYECMSVSLWNHRTPGTDQISLKKFMVPIEETVKYGVQNGNDGKVPIAGPAL